jgi:hypothetical protein
VWRIARVGRPAPDRKVTDHPRASIEQLRRRSAKVTAGLHDRTVEVRQRSVGNRFQQHESWRPKTDGIQLVVGLRSRGGALMTAGSVWLLCSRRLERGAPRLLAPVGLRIRVPGLGTEVHKSCYLADLGIADEEQDRASSDDPTEPKAAGDERAVCPNGSSLRDSRPPATCSLSGTQ